MVGYDLLYQLEHRPGVVGKKDLRGLGHRGWLRGTLGDTIMGGCISMVVQYELE